MLDRSAVAGLLGVAQQGLIHLGSSRAWKPVARARLQPQLRRFDGYDLVYSNSIASSAVLPYLPPAGAVVSHVHELQVALRTWRPPEYLDALDERSDAWIAASGAVRDLLVDERGYPPDRVLLHHEFIDARADRRPAGAAPGGRAAPPGARHPRRRCGRAWAPARSTGARAPTCSSSSPPRFADRPASRSASSGSAATSSAPTGNGSAPTSSGPGAITCTSSA